MKISFNSLAAAKKYNDEKMKTLVLLVLCTIAGIAASDPMVASLDSVMEQALFTHTKYVNATCRKLTT